MQKISDFLNIYLVIEHPEINPNLYLIITSSQKQFITRIIRTLTMCTAISRGRTAHAENTKYPSNIIFEVG